MPRSRPLLGALAAGFLLLGTSACSDGAPGASGSGKTTVVAAFYPLQFIAERVGGDAVTVSNLTKPGAEPHDLELAPNQVAAIGNADVVVYLAGFQPAVDEAVEQHAKGHAFDVAGVQPLSDAPAGGEEEAEKAGGQAHVNDGKDPHVWLDPLRLAAIVDQLATRLATADPDHAADIRGRAAALRAELEALDKEYAAGLATCQRREVVTSHAAFGYLAQDSDLVCRYNGGPNAGHTIVAEGVTYKLRQIPISGLSPEEDPSPQHLAEVTKLAKQSGVTTIFFETLVSPKVAEALASEVGAKAEVLDPIEGIDGGGDYLSVMRQNLARLRTALDCA